MPAGACDTGVYGGTTMKKDTYDGGGAFIAWDAELTRTNNGGGAFNVGDAFIAAAGVTHITPAGAFDLLAAGQM